MQTVVAVAAGQGDAINQRYESLVTSQIEVQVVEIMSPVTSPRRSPSVNTPHTPDESPAALNYVSN